MADTTKTITKRTPKMAVSKANLYVLATFNNTLATITDDSGNTLCWSSTGRVGFGGSRKSTPFAATQAIEKALEDLKPFSVKELKVYIKGPGPGRDAVLRVLKNTPYRITLLADVTPIAHNGTRPRKKKHNR